jgi:6-phosphogluconolactonase
MRTHPGYDPFSGGCTRSHSGILRAAFLRFLVPLLFCVALSVAARATTPVVVVISPGNNSQVSSPVHYVASATSSQCSKGIAAIRIYLAPHVSAFTVRSDSLDTNLTLSPGHYQTVVEAWDNCGGIGKAAANITVSAMGLRPARFLYATTDSGENQHIWGYLVDPRTGALTSTKQGPIAGVGGALALASDNGGYRLYAGTHFFDVHTNLDNAYVSAYLIDRRNGHLNPAPGPPFFLGIISSGAIAVHPSGKLVYAGTFNLGGVGNPGILAFDVNSDGSLTLLSSTPLPGRNSPSSLVIDPSGKYLYITETDSSINAFDINATSGALTPLPGSPFQVHTPGCAGVGITGLADVTGRYLYASDGFEFLAISGFAVSRTTGTLSEVPGSPFPDPSRNGCDFTREISGLTAEPTGRFLYVGFIGNNPFPPHNTIQMFAINAGNGSLTHVKDTAINYGGYNGGALAADPSGKYLYTSSDVGVIGFSISSSTGDLTVLPGSPFSTLPSLVQDLIVTP